MRAKITIAVDTDPHMGNLGNIKEQKIRIGILEFLCHHVFLYSLASIASNSGTEITIFTTKELYKRVEVLFKNKMDNYKWIIKGDDETLWSFLRHVEKMTHKELDLLFVNTIKPEGLMGYLSYLSFRPRCRSVLVTGRVTEWFGAKYKLISIRSFRKSLSYNIMHFVRKRILPRYDAVVVHAKSLKDYVLANGYIKEVFMLPFTIYDDESIKQPDNKIVKFLVAGSVAEHRRDYDSLLTVFDSLFKFHNEKISLTILGRPIGKYGDRIMKKCEVLHKSGFNIRYFHKFIPENTYKEEVTSADVIINPIRKENYVHGGYTAGLVDVIRHGKSGIYPSGYIVPEEVLSSSLFYDNIEGLQDVITDLLNDINLLNDLSQKAVVNSEKFSLEKMTSSFKKCVLFPLLYRK